MEQPGQEEFFHHPDRRAEGEKTNWIDSRRNVHKIFWVLVIVCAALVATDLLLHKHSKFGFEHWFGFFGFYGFCLSFLLVITSKQLRKILMRGEDYYDR